MTAVDETYTTGTADSARDGTPRVAWPWLALLALTLLGGLAMWVLLRPQLPAEDGVEATFARDMQAHHSQAVAMALPLRDRSTDPNLRTLALDIMLTQQAQIGQMQGWLATWGLPMSGTEPPMGGMGAMMGMASQQQVNDLQTLPVLQAEVSFLQLMIRHHQGGVAMAQAALRQTRQPAVVGWRRQSSPVSRARSR